MTIEDLGSAIRNRINDGLKGTISDVSYSREQLIKEAFILREKLIYEHSMKGKFDFTLFYQTIDSIPIEEMDLSTNAVIKSGICRNYITFPRIVPTFGKISIEYLGPVSKDKSYIIYYDTKFNHHKYRLRTSRNPYTYIDLDANNSGNVNAYLFNIGSFKAQRYLTVRGIFANPMDLSNFDCCTDIEQDEFPAPGWMQDTIMDRLVAKYVNDYRKLNIPDFPNTKTDIKG